MIIYITIKENDKINETVFMVFKPVIIAAPIKEYKNIFFLYSSFFSPINIPQNIQHINVINVKIATLVIPLK